MEEPDTLAVDWSGALRRARSTIWLAEARDRALVRLERGRDRREIVDHLVEMARRRRSIVVGLDFAFSFPAWFLGERGLRSASEGWSLVREDGERWLAACSQPFWGRKGRRRPPADSDRLPYRRTESRRPPLRGVGPKSVFQIGGAGAVGTGSLRGMPFLPELRAAGFSIWPFDPPRLPMIVEIYPRWLTGSVRKTSAIARALHLASRFRDLDPALADLAASTEDAFDAAVSALRMAEHASAFVELPQARDDVEALEGGIWSPLEDPCCALPHPGGSRILPASRAGRPAREIEWNASSSPR
ncbi:MAG: hypothetical protein ACKVXR_06340 [Planctomycetota bacterium]